jgi:hypothetical protein
VVVKQCLLCFGFYSDPGWTLADQVNQLTSNIKNTFFFNDRLNLTLSTQASVRDQSAPGSYDSLRDGVNGSTTRDFDINPFNYVLNTIEPYVLMMIMATMNTTEITGHL